jgi:prepilin-type N-terminal cleavage/methylation domain-containing protein
VRRHRGFTLIEVMVAAALLGIAATALFSLLSGSLANLKRVQDIHHYQLACQEMMNRVLLLSSLPPGGKIEGDLKDSSGHWVVTVTPWIPAKLENNTPEAVMKIDVEVQWSGRAGQRGLKLETLKASSLNYNNYDFQKAIESALPN